MFFSPIFVTWKTTENNELRGCIGSTKPINLSLGLQKLSLRSALNDSRFQPITVKELESLNCSVSILTDNESCARYDDWVIGIHGISIKFVYEGISYSALYLPEVMIEFSKNRFTLYFYISLLLEFNHEEALHSLVKKSGYKGPVDDSFLKTLKITRFQTRKSSVDVKYYIQIRNETHEKFI